MDNHRERIANFKIEPPGLFRGRGNHPKMGMLKRRIMPEDIIINCSKWVPPARPPPLSLGARSEVGASLAAGSWAHGARWNQWGRHDVPTRRSPRVFWVLTRGRKPGCQRSVGLSTSGHERWNSSSPLLISRPSRLVISTEIPRSLLLLQDINGKKSDMTTRSLG